MKTTTSFLLLIIPSLFAGCAGTGRILTDTVAAGGGAFAASKLSKGNPYITAAGAGGGLLLGEALNYGKDSRSKKAYAEGFDKGRSDAVKQQYWVMVNQQKGAEGKANDENISLFDLPLPEQRIDGVLLKPTTKVLRIEE